MRRSVTTLVMVVALAACGGGADGAGSTGAPATTTPTASSVVSGTPTTSGPIEESTTSTTEAASAASTDGCAHVVGVELEEMGDGVYRFDVTVSSADTGWDKYADLWEVRSPDGEVLGVRELAHPHETEQPFTRSLSGVEIPDGVDEVTVAARDSVDGFCGEVMTAALR